MCEKEMNNEQVKFIFNEVSKRLIEKIVSEQENIIKDVISEYKICSVCQKPFFSKTEKYCSDICQQKIISKTLSKECSQCHKSFQTTNKYKKYCSEECLKDFLKEKRKNDKPIFNRICYCGEIFKTSNNRQIHCSEKCRYDAKKIKRIEKIKNPIKYEQHQIVESIPSANKHLKELSKEKQIINKICAYEKCSSPFQTTNKRKKYCSKKCRSRQEDIYKKIRKTNLEEIPIIQTKKETGIKIVLDNNTIAFVKDETAANKLREKYNRKHPIEVDENFLKDDAENDVTNAIRIREEFLHKELTETDVRFSEEN